MKEATEADVNRKPFNQVNSLQLIMRCEKGKGVLTIFICFQGAKYDFDEWLYNIPTWHSFLSSIEAIKNWNSCKCSFRMR